MGARAVFIRLGVGMPWCWNATTRTESGWSSGCDWSTKQTLHVTRCIRMDQMGAVFVLQREVCNWTTRAVFGWVHGRHQRACASRRHELGKAAPLSPQPWFCDCGSSWGELKFGLYVTNLNSFKLTITTKPMTIILYASCIVTQKCLLFKLPLQCTNLLLCNVPEYNNQHTM